MKNPFSQPADSLHQVRPLRMALYMGVLSLLAMLIFGLTSSDPEIEWLLALTGIVLFAWMIAVVGFFNKRWKRFLLHAILGFILLNVVLLSAAQLISTSDLRDLPEFQSMLMASVLFFVVALFMSKFIQGLTDFFESH